MTCLGSADAYSLCYSLRSLDVRSQNYTAEMRLVMNGIISSAAKYKALQYIVKHKVIGQLFKGKLPHSQVEFFLALHDWQCLFDYPRSSGVSCMENSKAW